MSVRSITDTELQGYRRDGVVKLPGLVDATTVERLTISLDAQIASPSEWGGTGKQRSDRCFGLGSPVLRQYLTNETLGQNAARAMGSATANFFFDHMFLFEPDSPVDGHYWHQDQPYWPVQGEHIISFWLSLSSCTPETAALKFVPGSHKTQGFYRPKSFDGSALTGDLGDRAGLAIDAADQFLDIEPPAFHEQPDDHGVLEFSYEPGDAVMFHSQVVHSSGGNRSKTSRRLAYSARFFGDDARQMLRQGVFQDPALLPDADEPFAVGGPMISRRWPLVYADPLVLSTPTEVPNRSEIQ